jgi:hypothetical protein
MKIKIEDITRMYTILLFSGGGSFLTYKFFLLNHELVESGNLHFCLSTSTNRHLKCFLKEICRNL